MSEETVKKILEDLGLTVKEGEMYVFLAKHEALRSGEITKLIKMDKAEVFRVLTNLQTKGLVEKTLESPARFLSTPFERAIDSFIKYKRDEANLFERTKKDLIRDWNQITKTKQTLPLERFLVIEGRRKIYPRISEMIKETKNQLSSVTTVTGLLRAEQFGIFEEIFAHSSKGKINFRFVTEMANRDLVAMQKLLKKIPKNLANVKGRNSDFDFKLSPRMVIKDEDEILLFINPLSEESLAEKDDVCLWTNCKTIVQSFLAMFEDFWRNSTEITNSAQEIADFPAELESITDIEIAKDRYYKAIQAAKEEIMIITTSQGLVECIRDLPILREYKQQGILVHILAPLTKDNFEPAHDLSQFCQIRHIPTNYMEATIIDGKELFRFNPFDSKQTESKTMFYSDNLSYVKKIESTLKNMWNSSIPLSEKTLESILGPYSSRPSDLILRKKKIDKFVILEEKEKITEQEIINKILNAKRIAVKDISKDLHIMYACGGSAIVHPPKAFNLPDLLFEIHHIEKHSGFGQGDAITVFLWLKTPKGFMFVPAGGLGDNSQGVAFRKGIYAGYPAEENHRLVRKDELQIRVHNNTLFVGWTVPVPLLPPKYILPPACLLIEGYGNVKTDAYSTLMPSGFRNKVERNGFDAFVTFMHPSSKYSGPGTDGFFTRELILTMTPPQESGNSKVKQLSKNATEKTSE